METVKLRNGAEEFGPLVNVTMMSLRSLCEQNPFAFYDIVMFCRDGTEPFLGWPALEKASLGLVSGGRVHDSVRNVVVSAAVGDGLDMALRTPAAE